jgi:hypothetical protein
MCSSRLAYDWFTPYFSMLSMKLRERLRRAEWWAREVEEGQGAVKARKSIVLFDIFLVRAASLPFV